MVSQICRNVTNSAFKHYNWADLQKKEFKRKLTHEERNKRKLIASYGNYDSEALLFMEKDVEDHLKQELRVIIIKEKVRDKRSYVKEIGERLKKFGGLKSVDRFVNDVLNEEELVKIYNSIHRSI